MNLKTQISSGLWTSIAGAYQAENYSHAILDATYFMSNLIRERAGIDGDGSQLVGQALGEDLPRLKLNALETESEKNVQKGFEQILRGIYTGIRNPRSHDQVTDNKNTADAVSPLLIIYVVSSASRKRHLLLKLFLRGYLIQNLLRQHVMRS